MDNTSQLQTQQFLETLKDIETRVGNLERTPQLQIIDWYSLNPASFSILSADYLSTTITNTTSSFTIGDRLYMEFSNGDKKYFYVLSTTSTTIKVVAYSSGSGYSPSLPVGYTITKIQQSKLPSPSGFPVTFVYGQTNPVLISPVSGTVTYLLGVCNYQISAGIVFLHGVYAFSVGATNVNYIEIAEPVISDGWDGMIVTNPARYTLTGNSLSGSVVHGSTPNSLRLCPYPYANTFASGSTVFFEYDLNYSLASV